MEDRELDSFGATKSIIKYILGTNQGVIYTNSWNLYKYYHLYKWLLESFFKDKIKEPPFLSGAQGKGKRQ